MIYRNYEEESIFLKFEYLYRHDISGREGVLDMLVSEFEEINPDQNKGKNIFILNAPGGVWHNTILDHFSFVIQKLNNFVDVIWFPPNVLGRRIPEYKERDLLLKLLINYHARYWDVIEPDDIIPLLNAPRFWDRKEPEPDDIIHIEMTDGSHIYREPPRPSTFNNSWKKIIDLKKGDHLIIILQRMIFSPERLDWIFSHLNQEGISFIIVTSEDYFDHTMNIPEMTSLRDYEKAIEKINKKIDKKIYPSKIPEKYLNISFKKAVELIFGEEGISEEVFQSLFNFIKEYGILDEGLYLLKRCKEYLKSNPEKHLDKNIISMIIDHAL